ncbi:ABC-2 family transporter protein [Paenibacillus sp. S150]|uniref:ABC-2 family transporter protein n=1 Tax=Paenibacillus sp. S150 TaxID=2749826 RepID=UPI001C57315D|nr:ABC-2 family transporter protein [Paenibacillus sp. S150]MBW4082728.1 ABC-2 family transporter protein [Paenibacillus sp. S150]
MNPLKIYIRFIIVYLRSKMVHIIARQFEYTFLGHIILSIIIFCISIPKLSIDWTIFKALWFVLLLLGAVLIHSAIMIASGSISFWFVKSSAVLELAIYDLRSFLNYPITIYQKWIQILLTFFLPFAFINFFPAQYLLQKEGGMLFHPLLQYGAPIIGLISILLAYRVWDLGINQYQSTGS